MRELKIIWCENGYMLSHEEEIDDGIMRTVNIVIEDNENDKECMKRMLMAVAEHFGEMYDKFAPDNLEISFTRAGHKHENY